MLQHGFELVEALGKAGLGRLAGLVFLPQVADGCAQVVRQGSREGGDIGAFAVCLAVVGSLFGRGDIARDRLAEVVDEAEPHQLEHVDALQFGFEQEHQQAERPAVFGHAFGSPVTGARRAQRVLEGAGLLQEGKDAVLAVRCLHFVRLRDDAGIRQRRICADFRTVGANNCAVNRTNPRDGKSIWFQNVS